MAPTRDVERLKDGMIPRAARLPRFLVQEPLVAEMAVAESLEMAVAESQHHTALAAFGKQRRGSWFFQRMRYTLASFRRAGGTHKADDVELATGNQISAGERLAR